MVSLNRSIIKHIPSFLEYCEKEKHLLPKSIENYKRFLNRFVIWLQESNLTHLSPEELTLEHIQRYKDYLSKQISSETNLPITKKTQNLYLIVLRALLSCFIEKDISSLLPNKIKLFKEEKVQWSKNESLNLEQFERLLRAPDTSKTVGLRDKAILETLFSTGLKVAQLVSLDRDRIKIETDTKNLEIRILDKKNGYLRSVYLSERAINWLRKYLKTRQDNNKALFINYRGRRTPSRRLTIRSIERIVERYITRVNLPFPLTPETLRHAYILTLLNQETEIKITQNPLPHRVLIIKAYKFKTNKGSLNDLTKSQDIKLSQSPSWQTVEININKEINWLKNNISILPGGYKKNHLLLNCDECLLRKIAILIVSGKVKATEYKAEIGRDLWNSLTQQQNLRGKSKHGQEWHRKMMDIVSEYSKLQNYKVTLEPTLNYGRADLGIYLNPNKPLYIEVGTVSLFKLWYNLSTMKNTTFLVVPSEDYLIEFNT